MTRRAVAAWAVFALTVASPAQAVMDIDDRGPVLQAGNFAMRVTNVGVLGNAFFSKGLSFDPSLEFPKGSGHECLNHAELWVGARSADGSVHVSGGPMLEWRPTLDPTDRVRTAWAGQPGSLPGVDDDGDGRVDEEVLNGRDDDGDGEIDEDIGVPSQEMMGADYTDDQPAAVNYVYPTGEHHTPLHLTVHQEVYAWSAPGFDNVAGVTFTITNTGTERLTQVYAGLLADLDSRLRDEPGGHLNDSLAWQSYAMDIPMGLSSFKGFNPFDPNCYYNKTCVDHLGGTVPVVYDGVPGSGLPHVALLPMAHTTDPLALFTNDAFGPAVRAARESARAPGRDTTFKFSIFANDFPPAQGGPPVLDGDRYLALRHQYPQAVPTGRHDWNALLSCGPFSPLDPGQSISFSVAFVAANSTESLTVDMAQAAYLYRGRRLSLLPDSTRAINQDFAQGATGINGHEINYDPPAGITFIYDPHCPQKFITDPAYTICGFPPGGEAEDTYVHGHPIWTDLDCDACTGIDGADFIEHWGAAGTVPLGPSTLVTPLDHAIHVAWDNMPELLVNAGRTGAAGFHFAGYHVYRLSRWTRASEVPPPAQWELIGSYGVDTLNRQIPLASIRDTTIHFDSFRYGLKHYPIGYYRITDVNVLNGFNYLYAVTSVAERIVQIGTGTRLERLESPLASSIDSIVVPHISARPKAGDVWVVPNPFRASAPWDRQPVPGDPFGRHLDFFGLPRARSTIRIYTVAGDLVAELPHDGTRGDGEHPWNLISRNGQEVESGVYLFTVDSPLGHQIGRFVVIR